MKKITLIIICTFFMISAGVSDYINSKEKYYLEGVWELEHQFLYDHNEVSDTILNQNGYRQVKIYSKGKVMWTRYDPADQNEWFGYGTYTIKDNMLEERLEYASGTMTKIIDTTDVFKFELVMGKDFYQQIALNKDGSYSNSENYKRIE